MGFLLFDLDEAGEIRQGNTLALNFWHWRTILAAVRRLDVIPAERLDGLEESWLDGRLTQAEARAVAAALRERLIPTLEPGERLLLDGNRTTEPDDGVIHVGEETDRNYSTNRAVLEQFAAFCESCNGFLLG
jgi:hypothetical protein